MPVGINRRNLADGIQPCHLLRGQIPPDCGKVALPKIAVPGVGWLAYCQDPEGNMFGMMQNDTSAA
jgi:hypothetical protein